MHQKKHVYYLYIAPALVLFMAIYGWSIIQLLGTSFTEWRIGTEAVFNGIENYKKMFASDEFLDALGNTALWVLIQCTLHVAIGVLFALLVAKPRWYNKVARSIFMIPNIISTAALGMMFYCFFNPRFGFVNNFISNVVGTKFRLNWFMDAGTAFFTVSLTWVPFAGVICILMIAEMTSIDPAIYESAAIDGATQLETNLYITLPMLKGAIGTGTVLAATSMLQKFDIIMMTTNGGPGTMTMNLPFLIYKTAFKSNNLGYANAQGVVLMVLGLLCILLINRIYRNKDAM